MNNRNAVIGGIIIIILIALGIWYYTSAAPAANAPGGAATTTVSTDANVTVPPVTSNPSTFHSIFTQTGNHQCSYAQAGANTQNTSEVYISAGQMRGEFRTTGAVVSADFMIYNGGYLYSWKEGATTGKKSSIKSLADLPQAIPQDLTSGAILGTAADNVSWDCHDWIPDATYFALPAYVTFS